MDKDKFPQLSKFENELHHCIKCGFCSSFCPVYREEKTEAGLARGKNELIKALARGDLECTVELADRLYQCTGCNACTENCPTQTKISRMVVAARADVFDQIGMRFPYGLIYRHVLPRRYLFGNLVRLASKVQSLLMPKTNGVLRHLPTFLSGLSKGRQIPAIAKKFLRQQLPEVNQPPDGVKTVMRVGFMSGCMNEYVLPHTTIKTIEFLNRNGVEVILPKKQGCCGAPAFLGAGDFETGRVFADKNVKVFKNLDWVITDCATCACSVNEYSRFLPDTSGREVAYKTLAAKTKHITEFLTDILKLPASAYHTPEELKGLKLTWHDPCHLNRHLGIKEQPRQILNSFPDVEFVEMPEADRCCGMAGQFNLFYYELSKKIADKKVAGIEANGADVVVTACPGCQVQLMDALSRQGKPQKVMNIVELLS